MFGDSNKKIVATIEARMTSTRLPGKVLLPILGKPALEHLIFRLQASKYLDDIVVATTTNKTDEPIVELTKKLSVKCFRGSENDVLDRVLNAARSVAADIIVEITADCPMVDPKLVDRGIKEFYEKNVDYAANIINPTYPNGFDIQVFPVSILEKVATLTNDPIDRVHVSYYIYHHPEIFSLHNWVANPDEAGPELRVTLDEQKDYEAICKIFELLYPQNPLFSVQDVVKLLNANLEVRAINQYVKQKHVFEG